MSIEDALAAKYAPAWKPAVGESLIGEVAALSRRTGDYGDYPIVTVRQDDGAELAWHAYHHVGRTQLGEQRPKVGERIGVKYCGQREGAGGTSYHDYKLIIERQRRDDFWASGPELDADDDDAPPF
jgi:hypothetical protein